MVSPIAKTPVELTVIVLSAMIQITAVLFALGLILVTGGRTAWVLIAAAFCFLPLRRIISL